MSENKGMIAPTVIKSITAVLCSAAISLTGLSITTKVCENEKALAEKAGTTASVPVSADDSFADSDNTVNDEISETENTVSENDETTSANDNNAEDNSAQESTGSTDSEKEKKTEKEKKAEKEITLTSGLQSTDKSEVLKYYKLVAAENAKNGNFQSKMTMTSLDGGKGAVGAVISAFKPIAVSALKKNSTVADVIPGAPDKITEADWEKATAVNDGKYTTLTIQVKNQTDGADGKVNEGSVGRSIGVLDGIQQALDNLSGVSADFENGQFSLDYKDAYIKVKVDNATGKLVKDSCKWHYIVNVNMDLLEVKVTFIPATLNGGKGTVDYMVSY